MGEGYKKNSKLVQHANTFAFHCTSVSLKILFEYIENLKALIRPQDSQTKNLCDEFLIFIIYPPQ